MARLEAEGHYHPEVDYYYITAQSKVCYTTYIKATCQQLQF